MTKAQAADFCGICHDCKEWTTLLEPCCGWPIYAEGSSWSDDDIEDLDNEVSE